MADDASPPRPLRYGEALPLLHAAANRNPRFALGSLGGRFILFAVLPDAKTDVAKAAIKAVAEASKEEGVRVISIFNADAMAAPSLFDAAKEKLIFTDPAAAREGGLLDPKNAPEGRWILFDPSLRVLNLWKLSDTKAAIDALAATPEPGDHAGVALNAPVLVAPRVFEPAFCQQLIEYYNRQGGTPSGVTQARADGMTYVARDDNFKRRSDVLIEEKALRDAVMQRIYWRLGPEIEKAFMWRPTRMERYLVACYNAESGGFFKPHRDNTTKGTAHRRFAVTINLNAGEYDGGDLRFPEFGSKTYRAPTGGAVVFSCGLLHEATPVTRGKRYAFLPFMYDEAAAKVREDNDKYLDESIRPYRGE